MSSQPSRPGRRAAGRRPGSYVRSLLGAALVLASACGSPEIGTAYRLAEYLEALPARPSSASMVPPEGGGTLVEGWSPVGDDSTDYWAEGRAVHAAFELPAVHDTTLEVRLRPYVPEGTSDQGLELRVNGELIFTARDLPGRWWEESIPVPAELLRVGDNELQLLFDRALVPAQVEGGTDRRQLAARVSRLAIGNPEAQAPGVRLEALAASDGTLVTAVDVPAGLWHRLLLEVPEAAVLAGGVADAGPPEGASAASAEEPRRAQIVLHTGEGDRTALLDVEPTAAGHDFEIDLSPWAGQIVELTIGSSSGASRHTTWRGLDVRAPVGSIPVAALASDPVGGAEEAEFERPDIFVLILDAARADAFTPYGATRPTPAIQALADDGTVFGQAYSSAPWTGQAIPGIFSGRYPEAHGVDSWGYRLPATVPTLAETVGSLGYHTVLWTQHAIYGGNQTLRRGFDEFVEGPQEEPGVVPAVDDLVLDGAPTFAVVHWLPPHGPYAPPAPFRGRYSDWQEEPLNANAQFLNRFPRQQDPETLPAEHVRYVRDRYDDHVAYADDIVGRFVAGLREAGRYEDALVVVVSDHGEGFLEHGYFLHTRFLYEEVMLVPLVIKWPASLGRPEGRVETPVSTIQLFPTLVDGLGIDPAGLRHQAGSLLPLAFGGVDRPPWVYFSSRGVAPPDRDPRPLRGLRSGDWKVIYSQPEARLELYDLAADPGERNDLAASDSLRARFLHQQASLQRRRNELLLTAETPAGDAEQLSPETIERLRALGYIQ